MSFTASSPEYTSVDVVLAFDASAAVFTVLVELRVSNGETYESMALT